MCIRDSSGILFIFVSYFERFSVNVAVYQVLDVILSQRCRSLVFQRQFYLIISFVDFLVTGFGFVQFMVVTKSLKIRTVRKFVHKISESRSHNEVVSISQRVTTALEY